MRRVVLALLATLPLLFGIALAHVTSIYPMSLSVAPTNPPVVFQPGSNANAADLSGTITVSTGNSNTTLSVTVHPTFETTYYENISIIENKDTTKSYTVTLKVEDVIDTTQWPAGSKVVLYIFPSGAARTFDYTNLASGLVVPTGYTASLDLSTTSTATITLNAGQKYEVDLLVYVPDSSTLPPSDTALVSLEYSPSG